MAQADGALDRLPIPTVTATALWHARARLGSRPLRALFDLLRGPAASTLTSGSRWAGMLVCAIDGTYLDVPDNPRTRHRLGKGTNQYATAGYPQICLTTLVACGTRAVIDAAFGPRSNGETTYGLRLTRSLHSGMIVLLDRGFATNAFLAAIAGTGADLLARLTAVRKTPVIRLHRDGSYRSVVAGIPVRVIECEITIATSAGRQTGLYRLATTLLDHRRYPAFELVRLYHQRWEVESAYFEIKKTMLGRRVLRARTPAGIAQEIYALLTVYQSLRIAITDATDTDTTASPDRGSFTIALEAARDQVIQATGIVADETIDLIGTIGRHVLAHLMPDRRLRVSPRAVKRPLSRYAYKSLRVDRRTYKATLSIDILATPPGSSTPASP
ncbi:IS4 family transposase [Kitasatospora sp. NPDC101155]|uniref:IS4 family transposase n=1 Tax=Kitasatospora sp. NPDC101155 TaxID=3364097 RepID=UPI0038109F1B